MTKEDLCFFLASALGQKKRCCSRQSVHIPLLLPLVDPPAVGHPSADARLVHTLTCKLPLRRSDSLTD